MKTDKVYDFGKYMIGPDFEFKKFPADAQHMELKLEVFTKDKLEVSLGLEYPYISCRMQVVNIYFGVTPIDFLAVGRVLTLIKLDTDSFGTTYVTS